MKKIFSMIALMLMTAVGAMAQTYNVTVKDGTEDADKWTISPNPATAGQTVTVTYTGTKKVKSVKAVKKAAPTYTLLSAATTSDYGKVVCAAGHLHDAKTAVPAGCTAVGIVGKVTATGHGLILALQDASSSTWNTINGWASVTTYASTTLKLLPDNNARGSLKSYTKLGDVTVSDWAVAQKSDYEAIFTNLGSKTSDYQGFGMIYDGNVNAFITTGVGGTAMIEFQGIYQTATDAPDEYEWSDDAWQITPYYWYRNGKNKVYNVRPVLGF